MSADGPDILVFPPLASVVAPALAVVLELVWPLGVLPLPGVLWSTLLGLVLLGLAGWLAVSGARAFRAAGTNVDPRQPALQLVRAGLYRFTRNPMYLGMVLFQLGLGFAASLDWVLLLAPLLWAVLHFGVVLREEAYLTATFGAPYTAYLSETRRWL